MPLCPSPFAARRSTPAELDPLTLTSWRKSPAWPWHRYNHLASKSKREREREREGELLPNQLILQRYSLPHTKLETFTQSPSPGTKLSQSFIHLFEFIIESRSRINNFWFFFLFELFYFFFFFFFFLLFRNVGYRMFQMLLPEQYLAWFRDLLSKLTGSFGVKLLVHLCLEWVCLLRVLRATGTLLLVCKGERARGTSIPQMCTKYQAGQVSFALYSME